MTELLCLSWPLQLKGKGLEAESYVFTPYYCKVTCGIHGQNELTMPARLEGPCSTSLLKPVFWPGSPEACLCCHVSTAAQKTEVVVLCAIMSIPLFVSYVGRNVTIHPILMPPRTLNVKLGEKAGVEKTGEILYVVS